MFATLHGGYPCPRVDRRDPAATMRARLGRRPQPPAALIEQALITQQPEALPDRGLIDHDLPVLHNPAEPFTYRDKSP